MVKNRHQIHFTMNSTSIRKLHNLHNYAYVKVKVKVGFFYSATYSGNAATSRAVQS